MTFIEIQDAVLDSAFDESKRDSVKEWINFRHAWIWDFAEWTFRNATGSVTFTQGSQIASGLPANLRHVLEVYDSNGIPLRPLRDYREFFDRYNANLQNPNTTPESYTMVAGQMFIGPQGDGSTGILVYETSRPSLVNDNDTTGLPDGYDIALVHGGKAEGFKLTSIPLWQGFDDDFTAAVTAMQRNYLTEMRGQVGQMGAFRPRQWGA